MSDTSAARGTLRVTTCENDETLAAASGLFNQYRHDYGEPTDADERTLGWLTDMVQSKMLTVYLASMGSPADAPAIGLATGHAVPASLVMDGSGSCVTFTCSQGPVAKERQPLWSAQSARRHSQQARHDCPS